MKKLLIIWLFSMSPFLMAQQVAVLKYGGGGDWYANPTAVPNLVKYSNEHIKTNIDSTIETVEASSTEIYNYPIVFMTGHGNVSFSSAEIEGLKNYLTAGGFLHISDNYGLDKYIRTELKKIFPDLVLQEIPFNHAIFNQNYKFNGLPKIHEHDGNPPQGFGLFFEGRMICFYDYESDLSDGWEDQVIHNDLPEVREKALQMGANIISYVFKH